MDTDYTEKKMIHGKTNFSDFLFNFLSLKLDLQKTIFLFFFIFQYVLEDANSSEISRLCKKSLSEL